MKAIIEVEKFGIIEIVLDKDSAPVTVDNFVTLANKGFYNGLTFHRIITGIMNQGGSPKGNGTGGPGYTIKGEFKANGISNPIKHIRGTISMARSMDYNSAGSQFFIMHNDANYLDGQYAAFGKVVEGIEVVDAIAEVKTGFDDKPFETVTIKSIRVE